MMIMSHHLHVDVESLVYMLQIAPLQAGQQCSACVFTWHRAAWVLQQSISFTFVEMLGRQLQRSVRNDSRWVLL